MRADTAPPVSVVVSTYNRAHLLDRLVGALEAQDGPAGFEAVIVDNGSTDDTWATLERLAATTSIDLRPVRVETNKGPSAGRNAGWRAASAPLVAFTDDDCVPRPGWLRALVGRLKVAEVVQGRTLPHPEQAGNQGPFSRTQRITAGNLLFQTCNVGYRRDLLERLDGFDEAFRMVGDDTDLGWRAMEAGAGWLFEPDAVVWHDIRPSSFRAQLRDTPRWEGVVLAVQRHPRLRQLLHRRWFWKPSHPPAVLFLAGGVTVLVARSRTARIAGAGMLAPYLRFRVAVQPLRGGPRRRLAAIPLALVCDLAEVGVLALASARYRHVLL